MAENYTYGYGRYRDDYEDDAESYDSGYEADDETADYDDAERFEAEYLYRASYEAEDEAYDWNGESVDDKRLLTGTMDEPVNEVLDDPSVNESAAYQRIGRLKRSRRWQARARRQGEWIPPDLRRYSHPVFWPVGEPHAAGMAGLAAQGSARRVTMDPYEWYKITRDIQRQVFMAPLMTISEVARILELDEDLVKEIVQDLQEQGLLRSISFGCLMRPTTRYWVAPVYYDTTPWEDFERAVVSWHRDGGVGSLIKYDLPRVETINQVASRYAVDGWELEGVAWVERGAMQAVALYNRLESPETKSLVYFVWLTLWDTEREVWERLTDLPEAARRITQPGISGSVALVGPDRWAVARALPMAVERLREWQLEPRDVAAWVYADQWQAASGASMLDDTSQPFRPTLAPVRLDRFVWPRSRRSLGRTTLDTIISSCLWTRSDARTLYLILILLAQYAGVSIAHLAALAGKSDKDPITPKRMGTLLELGFAREAGIAGVANLGTRERPEAFSARGRWQMRFRLSLGPKGEGETQERQPGESRKDYVRRRANGAFLLMLAHGELSFREIVRRSWLGRLADRLGDRLVHEDLLVDFLGRYTTLGLEAAPASRARTVNVLGEGIDPDGMFYCSSPVGDGYHYLELELSHLGPKEIRRRLEKYQQRLTSYPLAVVCKTDRGGMNYDRIAQELGVPLVATSIPRLREKGFSGPAWVHQGQEVSISPVACPPQPVVP